MEDICGLKWVSSDEIIRDGKKYFLEYSNAPAEFITLWAQNSDIFTECNIYYDIENNVVEKRVLLDNNINLQNTSDFLNSNRENKDLEKISLNLVENIIDVEDKIPAKRVIKKIKNNDFHLECKITNIKTILCIVKQLKYIPIILCNTHSLKKWANAMNLLKIDGNVDTYDSYLNCETKYVDKRIIYPLGVKKTSYTWNINSSNIIIFDESHTIGNKKSELATLVMFSRFYKSKMLFISNKMLSSLNLMHIFAITIGSIDSKECYDNESILRSIIDLKIDS